MGKSMHKGHYGHYSGNSKFSKRHDEDYDAKEAYNKNLTASARLHYLENDRHDHDSPAKRKKLKAGSDTNYNRRDKDSYFYDEDFAADAGPVPTREELQEQRNEALKAKINKQK